VPHVAIGEAGKTITLDKDDEFLKFTVDPDVITLGIEGLKARFNHPFEVVDAAGRVHESIDHGAERRSRRALEHRPHQHGPAGDGRGILPHLF